MSIRTPSSMLDFFITTMIWAALILGGMFATFVLLYNITTLNTAKNALSMTADMVKDEADKSGRILSQNVIADTFNDYTKDSILDSIVGAPKINASDVVVEKGNTTRTGDINNRYGDWGTFTIRAEVPLIGKHKMKMYETRSVANRGYFDEGYVER